MTRNSSRSHIMQMIDSNKEILLTSSLSQIRRHLRMRTRSSADHSGGVGELLGGGEVGGAFGVASFRYVFGMSVLESLSIMHRDRIAMYGRRT